MTPIVSMPRYALALALVSTTTVLLPVAAHEHSQEPYEPSPHFHDYWGDRSDVDVFFGALELGADTDGVSGPCRTTARVAFDLESDGNDVEPADPPVNPAPYLGPAPRADVVFAGTDRIVVRLIEAELPPGTRLFLRFQPPNLNDLQPEAGCGLALAVDEAVTIPVGPGGADPAHQIAWSRWRFLASAATTTGTETLPSAAPGRFVLRMTAHRGDGPTLDPAHPDLFGDADTFDLGCASAEVPPQAILFAPQTPAHRPPRPPLADIEWTHGRIVPLLTGSVEVRLRDTLRTSVPGEPVDLWFHAADTNVYHPAPPPVQDGDARVYTIPDPQGLLADPPYVDRTYWRFLLMPRPGPLGTGATVVEGDYELCAVAHRGEGTLA